MIVRRRLAAGLIAAALLAAAGGLAWRLGRSVVVPVAVAAPGFIVARVVGPGTVQARVPVTISARVSAAITQVHVDVGDAVHLAQLLVTLDDRDLGARRGVVAGQQEALQRNTEGARATLAKATAELELARSRQQRDAELLAQGFVSQSAIDGSNASLRGAAAGVDAAKAALAALRAEAGTLTQEAKYADAVLSNTRIVSPIDGVVVQRLGEGGDTVVPGTPILKLVDPRTLWVATRVDESAVGRIRPGQPSRIRLRSGEVLTGKAARIAWQSDAATRELDVHVAIDAVPLRFAIDQEAEVSIDVGEDRGIVIPLAALTRDTTGRQGVLVIESGRTRFQPVETAGADGGTLLVSKGLTGGESVVAIAAGVATNLRVRPASGVAP